jgi:hypothetical protein
VNKWRTFKRMGLVFLVACVLVAVLDPQSSAGPFLGGLATGMFLAWIIEMVAP